LEVSILDLMDCRVKTLLSFTGDPYCGRFNP